MERRRRRLRLHERAGKAWEVQKQACFSGKGGALKKWIRMRMMLRAVRCRWQPRLLFRARCTSVSVRASAATKVAGRKVVALLRTGHYTLLVCCYRYVCGTDGGFCATKRRMRDPKRNVCVS